MDTKGVLFERCGEVGTLTLQGRISVADAEDVLTASRQAYDEESAEKIHLQCEDVEHADLSSLQILLALCTALKGKQRNLEITPPSHSAARQAFRLVGLGI